MHHVNLKTTRLQAMVDWYGQVIGSRPNFQSGMIAFLTNDDANHRIALTSLPGLKDDDDKAQRTGIHHTAFEYETLDDLLASYLRLKHEGILPGTCLDHGMTLSFYYIDPDANLVELQVDNYGDWAASTDFMRHDERFVANPVGEFVDPEAIVAARRAGLTPWEIHERDGDAVDGHAVAGTGGSGACSGRRSGARAVRPTASSDHTRVSHSNDTDPTCSHTVHAG
jgi:catechol 2,3-dioxygenase